MAAADRAYPLSAVQVFNCLKPNSQLRWPRTYGQPSLGEFAPVITRWDKELGQCLLMKDGVEFVFAGPIVNTSPVIYSRHENISLLRIYVCDSLGFSMPILND